jgi:transposase-like protein
MVRQSSFSCVSAGSCARRESSRDLQDLMREGGLQLDHSTIERWVHGCAPQIEKGCRPPLTACNESCRVEEPSINVRNTWMSL